MKEIKEDGREYVDGTPVEFYEGKFVGIFPMSEDIAVPICEGDIFTFMVTVTTDVPKFSRVRKTGELKRVNNFRVEEAVFLDRDKAAAMYDSLGLTVFGVNEGFELDDEDIDSPVLEFDELDDDDEDESVVIEVGVPEPPGDPFSGGTLFDVDGDDDEELLANE